MIRPLCLLLALAACNAPGPHFLGQPATRVAVDDMVFDVRIQGHLAQAMRINTQWAPRVSGVTGPATRAMEHVSGCRVTELRGDQALLLGVLDCADGSPVRLVVPVVTELDCLEVDSWTNHGLNQRTTILDCDASI